MGEPSAITVRRYRPEDREAVRDICWATAYMGESIEYMYRDRESWVDLFSGHFTDREAAGCFVACDGSGQVVGYLLGTRDARRVVRSFLRFVVRHLVWRLLWLRPAAARFWWRLLWDWLVTRDAPPAFDRRAYPAEMHINLRPGARAHGAAHALLQAWHDDLRRAGVAGAHVHVFADNARGLRFFEKHGYVRRGPAYRVPGMRRPDGSRMRVQLLLRDLAA